MHCPLYPCLLPATFSASVTIPNAGRLEDVVAHSLTTDPRTASWDQYARDWNRPVHKFLLRYVYHASMTGAGAGRETATVVTFLVSACMHELVAWCIFRKLRGYLFVLQMSQLPLIRLSRTPWLRGRTTSGNVSFWIGIGVGPSLLASLYLVL